MVRYYGLYTTRGYEKKTPEWCYGEETDYLNETNDPEPLCWQCQNVIKEHYITKESNYNFYFNTDYPLFYNFPKIKISLFLLTEDF